ncbi:unnamed protein product [Camellia sinensis]
MVGLTSLIHCILLLMAILFIMSGIISAAHSPVPPSGPGGPVFGSGSPPGPGDRITDNKSKGAP